MKAKINISKMMYWILLAATFACSSPTESLDQESEAPQITLGGKATARLISSDKYRIEIVINAINVGEEISGTLVGHVYLFRQNQGEVESITEHKTKYIFPDSAPYEWGPLRHGWTSISSDSLYTLEQAQQLWLGVAYEIEED